MAEHNKVLYPTAYVGSFGIYYNSRQKLILVIERGNKEGLGVPGGYMDIGTTREQPPENAVREFNEEIIMPDGSPVLKKINPSRLIILDSGFDYNAAIPGTNHKGTCWNAFKCRLNDKETETLKSYTHRMATDPGFADAVRQRSNGELRNAFLISARDLVSKHDSGKTGFRYDHEERMVLRVARKLLSRKPF